MDPLWNQIHARRRCTERYLPTLQWSQSLAMIGTCRSHSATTRVTMACGRAYGYECHMLDQWALLNDRRSLLLLRTTAMMAPRTRIDAPATFVTDSMLPPGVTADAVRASAPTPTTARFRRPGGAVALQTHTSSSSLLSPQACWEVPAAKCLHCCPGSRGPSLKRAVQVMPYRAHMDEQLPPAGIESKRTAQSHVPWAH